MGVDDHPALRVMARENAATNDTRRTALWNWSAPLSLSEPAAAALRENMRDDEATYDLFKERLLSY